MVTRTPSKHVRSEVMRAAVALLASSGPDGLTVRALASAAGVAPMAIYNHFDGLNGVIDALWCDGFRGLHDAIAQPSHDADDDLRRAGEAYRRYALEHRGLYLVMFLHRFKHFVPSEAGLVAATEAFGALETLVRRAQRTGTIREGDPDELARLIWSAVHGFVAIELMGEPTPADLNRSYEAYLTMIRQGLSPDRH
jgi:AcrR family transcriptional regulator